MSIYFNHIHYSLFSFLQKKKKLEKITVTEQITGNAGSFEQVKKDRDAFDTLFEHAPEKLELVKNVSYFFV